MATGGFRSDGSWRQDGPGGAPDVDRLARALIAARRGQEFSPRDAALRVKASGLASAFNGPILEIWQSMADPRDWRRAPTARSVEEAVKRCGRENHLPGDWHGPHWRTRDEGQRPEQAALAERYGWD